MSQRKYLEDLLKMFHMQGCKPVSVLMTPETKMQVFLKSEEANATVFRSLIGKLLHLTNSRTDIMFVVNLLSTFMSKPTRIQFTIAKCILRYLAGTLDYGIQYDRGANCVLEGFSDSDWSGDLNDRKSTSGYVFSLRTRAVCWSSKKQKVVALSTTETEYMSLCLACCHGIWMRGILIDCGMQYDVPITMWCDSKSSIDIAKNPTLHGRTKHFDIKFHFIRDLVAKKEVNLNFYRTDEQVADGLTKCLNFQNHCRFRKQLEVCSLQTKGRLSAN